MRGGEHINDLTGAPLPCAGERGGGNSAAVPFLSPFLHAGSRPTFHEWCAAITDPSRRARHLPADCHCGVAALLDPFHRSGVPHG